MPRIESTVRVNVPVDDAFVVSQSQQEVRYRWDPFVRQQLLLNGAIGRKMLQRDIDRRLAGFAATCADPSIVEAARRQLG